MQNEQQSSNSLTFSDSANWVFTIAHVWSLPWELLLRKNFGWRYIDIYVLVAMIWPPLFACLLFPQYDPRWSLWMFWGLLALTIYHRLAQLRNRWKGVVLHSQYPGYPIFCRPSWDEMWFKRQREPLLILCLSFLSIGISPSLFLFSMGSFFAVIVKRLMCEFYQEQRAADMQDAIIEQQSLAEQFRRRF